MDKNDENIGSENDKNDIIDVTVNFKPNYYMKLSQNIKLNEVRTILENEFNMGSNCRFLYFSKNKSEIRLGCETILDLLDITEKKDNGHNLFITQNDDEFDLTQLCSEKGFRINKNGSVTSASDQAFEINYKKVKIKKITKKRKEECECKHETTTECKRSFIFDAKLSAAFSEWVIRGVINLPILEKNIIAAKNFIEDVEKIVNDDTTNDKISVVIIRNEEYTKNS
ncbi:13996_t:CDS:2, partial [Dentiscutata heterogama]